MAQLDNAKPERNIEAGILEVFSNSAKIFHFSEEYAAREDAGVEQMMHILCTHQRFRSKTRSCGEILEGNGEKYYKEMQRNI